MVVRKRIVVSKLANRIVHIREGHLSVLLIMVALCNRADHYIFILFLLYYYYYYYYAVDDAR